MMNGEVWLNNEQFNSLGGDSAGVGLPPPIPLTAVPTAGQTPTATPTDTPGPTPSATITPTITMTPSPTPCSTHFEEILVDGNGFANVTGDVGGNIILYDRGIPGTPPAGTPPVLGTAVLGAFDGHDCPGFGIAGNADTDTQPDVHAVANPSAVKYTYTNFVAYPSQRLYRKLTELQQWARRSVYLTGL
jgi:hypothetical protein